MPASPFENPRSRPDLPPGPFLVAGLGRAGHAAAQGLLGRRARVQVWDSCRRPWVVRRQEALTAMNVPATVGGDGVALLRQDPVPRTIVKSPGMDPDAPLLRAARERGLVVIDELELGWRLHARPLIGVTGTNGKSTAVRMLQQIVESTGVPALVAGNTESGPPLSGVNDPAGVIVCEVSSYQLESCSHLLPDAAAFTGLSRDHLERHGTMDAYAAVKRKLFVRGDEAVRFAGVRVDDHFGRRLADEIEDLGGRVTRVGASPEADLRLLECAATANGTAVVASWGERELVLSTLLVGAHNALNALVALGTALATGIDLDTASGAVAVTPGVPGRMELAGRELGVQVFVDFAHNVAGVEAALSAAREAITARSGRLIAVLSARRWAAPASVREMGAAARRLADVLILTGERRLPEEPPDPRSELVEGAGRREGAVEIIADRRRAIGRAVRQARRGDVVVVLGRGAREDALVEESGERRSFDDRAVAIDALAGLESRGGSTAVAPA